MMTFIIIRFENVICCYLNTKIKREAFTPQAQIQQQQKPTKRSRRTKTRNNERKKNTANLVLLFICNYLYIFLLRQRK